MALPDNEVANHSFHETGSYIVSEGYNTLIPFELEVKKIAGNYILCRKVKYDDSETFFEWKDGGKFNLLAKVPADDSADK